MQLHQTLSIALLSLLLFACGGSLEETAETAETADPKDTTDGGVPIVDAVAGDPSYFTYEGAMPEWISIKGTGGVDRKESATISFKLVDANGEAIVGEPVTFTLDQFPVGSILLLEDGVTDASGLVNTSVKSGIGAGPIIITAASVNYPEITQRSNNLAVSTGLPDQDSFTLSVDNLSPEGLNYNGAVVNVTVDLGGHGNTPVPDGTVVEFRAEGGIIINKTVEGVEWPVSSCATVDSTCSVEWKSTNPKPADGRVTITAYSTGTESFKDTSPSDGAYSDGEVFTDSSEVFADDNYNGVYDDSDEWYRDVDDALGVKDQAFSSGDGKYTGMQCPEDVDYCNRRVVDIFQNFEIVMAGSFQTCRFTDINDNPLTQIDLTTLTGNESVQVKVAVSDVNDNVPPSGTTISAVTGNGVLGENSWKIPNSAANSFDFLVELKREAELNESTTGYATFTITTPRENKSTCSIQVIDDAPAAP